MFREIAKFSFKISTVKRTKNVKNKKQKKIKKQKKETDQKAQTWGGVLLIKQIVSGSRRLAAKCAGPAGCGEGEASTINQHF